MKRLKRASEPRGSQRILSNPDFSYDLCMFHLSDVMKIQQGEKVLGVFRAHSVALVVRLLGLALLIVLPCFFVFPLFRLGPVGVLLFLIPVLIGGLGAWRAVRLWDATVLILSDHRLVHVAQRGIWDRHVSEVAFSHVGDIQWEKRGFWQTLWGIGAVRIRTNGGAVPSISMNDLRGPERLAQSIQELRGHGSKGMPHDASKANTHAQRERLIHLIEHASEEELNKLEEVMHTVVS